MSTVWGTVLAALFLILTLSNWELRGHALSVIPVAALLVGYIILMPRTDRSTRWLPHFDVEKAIGPLSLRVVILLVIILGVDAVLFGLPRSSVVTTLTLGLTKALTWYSLVLTVCYTRPCQKTIFLPLGTLTGLLDPEVLLVHCYGDRIF